MALGSALVPSAGDGVSPSRTFLNITSQRRSNAPRKACFGERPKPARGTHALPRTLIRRLEMGTPRRRIPDEIVKSLARLQERPEISHSMSTHPTQYAHPAFRLFGHEKVKILNGGRDKWKAERRPMTREVPKYPETNYPVPKKRFDKEIRAFFDEALAQSKGGKPLIDVRSPGEYKGEITHMPEYPQEGVLRGGHIPGAKSMPWKTATNDDATFKPANELAKIYLDQCGVKPGTDTIVYCRIGERSSHTWFVLTYLLGLDNVRNYDGSWTEWGNKVGAPIEKGGS